MDIKETLEIVEGLKETAVSAKKLKVVVDKILKDGIGIEDVKHISELKEAMPDFSELKDAVANAKEALAEMKDLDKEEVIRLIAALYEAIEAIEKA